MSVCSRNSGLDRLEDLTNDQRGWRPPSSIFDERQSHLLHEKILRRRRSLQGLQLSLSSSETPPSHRTLIYDAEPVLSDDGLDQRPRSLEEGDWPVRPTNITELNSRLSPAYEGLSWLTDPRSSMLNPSPQTPPYANSHGLQPPAHLDAIIEQMSRRMLRLSMSLPRTSSSLEHPSSALETPEGSSCGVGKTSRRGNKPNRLVNICHQRSFSLNDLDCMNNPLTKFASNIGSSSSSGEALPNARLCSKYPLRPVDPPPHRAPTPPDLPTFGTREAMEYRLPPFQLSHLRSSRNHSRHSRPSSTNTATSPTGQPESPPINALKRLLNIPRIVHSPPEEPLRAVMPPFLARADDGTFVRGRFGARHSAHGIGPRGRLEDHPFYRHDRESNNIDQVCREIDKACAEACALARRSTPGGDHGAWSPTNRNASPGSDLRMESIAAVLQGPPTSHPPAEVAAGHDSAPHPSSTTFGFGSRERSRSADRSSRMDGIEGIRIFIEQGERSSVDLQRAAGLKKEEQGACQQCWISFWQSCCGAAPENEVDLSSVMGSPQMRATPRIENVQPRRVGVPCYSGTGTVVR